MEAGELAALFGTIRFELRFDLAGRAAVRAAGGPVAPRHVEPAVPDAPWLARAGCGPAAGWLLAEAAPDDPERARALLQRAVERETALALQSRARQASAMGADLLERLTHRLRTDVATLQAVADGALRGLFEAEDLELLPGELERTGREAQRRLTGVREVMTVLDPAARSAPEPVVKTLRAELEAAGRDATVTGPAGEQPLALIPGAGWATCARLLASDARRAAFAVEPDPAGWRVVAGDPRTPVEWTERSVGAAAHAGHIVAAAGGSAAAAAEGMTLVLPAAPPSG